MSTPDRSPDRRAVLRRGFDRAAEQYDRARPGYPSQLFEDIIALSCIEARGRILEIGAGTGKATVEFAHRGYRVTCIEPGAQLAAVLRRNVAPYPGVDVIVSDFEAYAIERGAYDLVIAASSFAWVDPAVRYQRVADALRPGGCVALFRNTNVEPRGEQGIYGAISRIYHEHHMENAGLPPHPDDLLAVIDPAFADSGLFEELAARQYPWSQTYTTAEYFELLGTFSAELALSPGARDALFRDIAALIDGAYGGSFTKHNVAELEMARRL